MFFFVHCRKYTMLLNNAVIVVAVGLQSLAVHPVMLIVGRFISGINSGTCIQWNPLLFNGQPGLSMMVTHRALPKLQDKAILSTIAKPSFPNNGHYGGVPLHVHKFYRHVHGWALASSPVSLIFFNATIFFCV